MSKPSIGFVGLGAMGFGMATNLVKAGYPVHGYDAYPPSIERFQKSGGIVATSLQDSARGMNYYVCMVASATQVQSVLFGDDGIVSVLPQNATLLLCSTVPASYAQSVADRLKSNQRGDIKFIDCPVSGGAKRAADGTLSIMAGASDEALASGKFLLEAMSETSKLYLMPGGIGAGSNVKMVHQILAGIHILGASEAQGFAAQLGLSAVDTAEYIKSSDAWTWMHENRAPRMVDEDWNPGVSAVTIILKDVGIITTSGRNNHVPTPLCSTAEQIYLAALLQGFGAVDDSCLIRQYFTNPIKTVSSQNSTEETAEAKQLVLDLMEVTNLVAVAEAVAFAVKLNVDPKLFYTLVCDAAGASKQFEKNALRMIEQRFDVDGEHLETLNSAIARLERAVQKARDLHFPLHLGNAALNVLYMAKCAGLGEKASSSVVGMFGGENFKGRL